MQQLHLVGITTELDGLIFSARRGARSGTFVVPITEDLLDSIGQADKLRREAEPEVALDETASAVRRMRPSARPESRLTPREMQARLRAGQSVAQVARAAAVGEEWVDRFAAPILAEQARVLDMALGLPVTGGRQGASALPLSESVRVNLHDRGVPLVPEPEGWSAHNLGGGRWSVLFEYVSRRRRQVAEWDLDLETRELTSRNRLAADIGHVSSPRRRVPVALAAAPEEPPAPAGRLTSSASGSPNSSAPRAAARKAPARKAPARKVSARKTSARKAPARKAPARKAPARKAPARKALARTAPARKVSARKASARKAPPRKASAGKRPVVGRKAPGKKTAARTAAARRSSSARSSAPRSSPARRSAAKRGPAKKAASRRRGR